MPTTSRTRTWVLRAIVSAAAALGGACVEQEPPAPTPCAEGDETCQRREKPPECICADIYQPVCGQDGTTYGNACEAACANSDVQYEGECRASVDAGPSCVCPAIYKPVCGKDGQTYGNACEASCASVPVVSEGECAEAGCGGAACQSNADCAKGDICDPASHQCQPECTIACLVYEPVCGTDGITYGCGQADAYCHGVEVAYPGECESRPCACTKEYRPVCGVDGTTYGNRCMARCASVAIAQEGECKAPAGVCTYDGKTYQAGASFPSSDGCNSCSCTADGLVACTLKACVCDYSDPQRKWASRSAEQCKLVKFACEVGQRPFFNSCGCGCEPEPASVSCRVGGCSGQLCVGPGEPDVSTCEWREEYACYSSATCEVQPSGRCGWTPTPELRSCLAGAR